MLSIKCRPTGPMKVQGEPCKKYHNCQVSACFRNCSGGFKVTLDLKKWGSVKREISKLMNILFFKISRLQKSLRSRQDRPQNHTLRHLASKRIPSHQNQTKLIQSWSSVPLPLRMCWPSYQPKRALNLDCKAKPEVRRSRKHFMKQATTSLAYKNHDWEKKHALRRSTTLCSVPVLHHEVPLVSRSGSRVRWVWANRDTTSRSSTSRFWPKTQDSWSSELPHPSCGPLSLRPMHLLRRPHLTLWPHGGNNWTRQSQRNLKVGRGSYLFR